MPPAGQPLAGLLATRGANQPGAGLPYPGGTAGPGGLLGQAGQADETSQLSRSLQQAQQAARLAGQAVNDLTRGLQGLGRELRSGAGALREFSLGVRELQRQLRAGLPSGLAPSVALRPAMQPSAAAPQRPVPNLPLVLAGAVGASLAGSALARSLPLELISPRPGAPESPAQRVIPRGRKRLPAPAGQPFDINSLTGEQLQAQVTGIGAAKAAKIEAEKAKAPFKDVEDLIGRVPGLGGQTGERLRALATGAPAPPEAPRPPRPLTAIQTLDRRDRDAGRQLRFETQFGEQVTGKRAGQFAGTLDKEAQAAGKQRLNTAREELEVIKARERYLASRAGIAEAKERLRIEKELEVTRRRLANTDPDEKAKKKKENKDQRDPGGDFSGAARQGFVAASAGIAALTATADPVAFDTFRASVEGLAISIGGSLGPGVIEVSGYLQRMADYVDRLDPGFKSGAASVALWTTGALGAAYAVTKLIAGARILGTVLSVGLLNPVGASVMGLAAIGGTVAYLTNGFGLLASRAKEAGEEMGRTGRVGMGGVRPGGEPERRREAIRPDDLSHLPQGLRDRVMMDVGAGRHAEAMAALQQHEEEQRREAAQVRLRTAALAALPPEQRERANRVLEEYSAATSTEQRERAASTRAGGVSGEQWREMQAFARDQAERLRAAAPAIGGAVPNLQQILENEAWQEAMRQNRSFRAMSPEAQRRWAGLTSRGRESENMTYGVAPGSSMINNLRTLVNSLVSGPASAAEQAAAATARLREGIGEVGGTRLSLRSLPRVQAFGTGAEYGEWLTQQSLQPQGTQDIVNEMAKITNILRTLGLGVDAKLDPVAGAIQELRDMMRSAGF
jgi:hypothetical protein